MPRFAPSEDLLGFLRRASRGGSSFLSWVALIKLGLVTGAALGASVHALLH